MGPSQEQVLMQIPCIICFRYSITLYFRLTDSECYQVFTHACVMYTVYIDNNCYINF